MLYCAAYATYACMPLQVRVGYSRSLDTEYQAGQLMQRHAAAQAGAASVRLTQMAAPYGYGPPLLSDASPPSWGGKHYLTGDTASGVSGGVMSAAPPLHSPSHSSAAAAAAAVVTTTTSTTADGQSDALQLLEQLQLQQQQQQQQQEHYQQQQEGPSSMPAQTSVWKHRRHSTTPQLGLGHGMPLVREVSRESMVSRDTSGGTTTSSNDDATAIATATAGATAAAAGAEGTPPTAHSTPPFSFRGKGEGGACAALKLEQPVVSFSPPFSVAPINYLALGLASDRSSVHTAHSTLSGYPPQHYSGAISASASRSILALTAASQAQLDSLPESPYRGTTTAAAAGGAGAMYAFGSSAGAHSSTGDHLSSYSVVAAAAASSLPLYGSSAAGSLAYYHQHLQQQYSSSGGISSSSALRSASGAAAGQPYRERRLSATAAGTSSSSQAMLSVRFAAALTAAADAEAPPFALSSSSAHDNSGINSAAGYSTAAAAAAVVDASRASRMLSTSAQGLSSDLAALERSQALAGLSSRHWSATAASGASAAAVAGSSASSSSALPLSAAAPSLHMGHKSVVSRMLKCSS
jgi:trimeric autotransporter adhesin